jgi:hypothetical protein
MQDSAIHAARFAAAAALGLTLVGVTPVAAQPAHTNPPGVPASGTGQIRGRIVAADTGAPVRFATVSLLSPRTGGWTTTTDASGRFEFSELPAGTFSIRAAKGGFVQTFFGPAGTIVLKDGQRFDAQDFRLARGGVITGRVVDASGEPVVEAHVSAFRSEYIQPGVRRLSTTRGFQTNDLGEFRVYGLAPGKYYVGASLRPMPGAAGEPGAPPSRIVATSQGVATTFFPGTATASDARVVVVAAGKETPGVEFGLLAVPLARVSGTVVDSRGRSAPNVVVMLNPARADGALIPTGGFFNMVEADASGRFTLPNVAPGDYRIDVESKKRLENIANTGGVGRPMEGELDEFASMPIAVGGENLEAVTVQTSIGSQMTGRVQVEGGSLSADALARLSISASPVMQGTGLSATLQHAFGKVNVADGTFAVRGLTGRRLVRVNGLPAGFVLKSVSANGVDVTDEGVDIGADVTGVEIAITGKPTTVTGDVTDANRKPVKDYALVIFAADARRWTAPLNRFVTAVRPNETGSFTVTALPAGDYLAAVVDSLNAGQWADPDNLERLRATATPFSLSDGEAKTLPLIRR